MLTRTIAQARAQPTSLHIVLLLSLCAPLLKLAGPQRTIVGACGVVDLVNFVLPGDATSKSHSSVKKDIPFLQMLGVLTHYVDLPPNVKTNRFDCSFVLLAWRRHGFGLNIGRQNHLMHEMRYSKKEQTFFTG